uniref:Repressor domain protein n=1 Tax=Siphoviridae sp. ctzyE57 TaxID=2827982 RepID=A0A8S5SHG9_9CAUD|nr:MAG TPA: repressor domain protein [Siphoviridae sp. ctzyE57]
MNELKTFQNPKFGTIRTTTINGEPWFVAADVCKALDLNNNRMAIERLDVDEKGVSSIDTPGGKQELTIVNEPGLYALVLGSRKPEAKAFKRWITHDVIPTIRKHGAYMTPEKVEEILLNPDTIIKLATELKEERERTAALNAKIKADKPYTEFGAAIAANSDAILVRDFAKLLHNDGIKMGEKRLYKWLRENGFLMQTAPTKPYQKYVDMGWFRVDERSISTVQGQMIVSTTKITGKGQMGLLSALRASRGGN